ncbi:hypothetical protein HC928_09120 [bacterium]|nr:hypothetical protein [bacterium]
MEDLTSQCLLDDANHNLDQFIQGNTVNLKALASYAIAQLVSDTPTLRRDELLMLIALYTKLTHNAPSHRQIGAAFDLSKTTIKNHLIKLERDGRVRVIDGRLMLIGSEYHFPKNFLDE